jgi:hypothetical protein
LKFFLCILITETLKGKHHQSVSVMVASQKSEFLICSLNYKHQTQQPLDLNFNEGEEVTFFINGPGKNSKSDFSVYSRIRKTRGIVIEKRENLLHLLIFSLLFLCKMSPCLWISLGEFSKIWVNPPIPPPRIDTESANFFRKSL